MNQQIVNMSSEASASKKVQIKPIIISNRNMVIKSPHLLTNYRRTVPQFKEEVIYASSSCDFLKGEPQEVLIVNRVSLVHKSCRTIARYTRHGKVVETTSDKVSGVIGLKNYETALTALSSVFNEETKVRGILGLLTVPTQSKTVATQTEMEPKRELINSASQTVESQLNMFFKEKQRKRIRRQPLTPYVVTKKPCKVRKFVINIDDVKKEKSEQVKETPNLPDLKLVVDEDSNMSCGSVGNISLSSLPSVPGILDNPSSLLTEIDKVTDKTLNSTEITLRDGSVVMLPVKPEDVFHLATPEILKNVTHEERMKLIWHQAFIDFKKCLEQDEDGYYPLHIAVLNNDADLVRRQCASLRARHETVDIPAAGLTALQMAVRQNVNLSCTNILLQNGADPLLFDQERRTSLHLAAESDSGQLRCLLAYCDTHARSVLKNNQDFWRPDLESKTDEELKRYLYRCVSEMYDEQGYTPLMIAAEAGLPSHVALLAPRAGALVDAAAPGCGATALHRVVAKACLHAKETNSKITPEKYLKTIEILVEHGADPSIENHAGSSVNTLLTEFNISAISMSIANKMTAMKHGAHASDPLNMMLYKHNDGRIGYKELYKVTTDKNGKKVSAVHTIITVDFPTKSPKKEAGIDETDSDTGHNRNDSISGDSSEIVDANETKSFEVNRISGVKDLKLENDVLPDNNARSKEQIRRLSDVIKNEINICLKAKISMKDTNDDSNRNNLKLGNMAMKKANINIDEKVDSVNKTSSDKNITYTPAVKVKGLKTSFTTVGAKRFKSGLLAITHVKTPINALAKNGDYKQVDVKAELTNDETAGSAKERKKDNVVIVENVPLSKEFAVPNIKPGISKTAKPRDIVITSTKVNTNNIASPKVEKDDADIYKNFRKRKI